MGRDDPDGRALMIALAAEDDSLSAIFTGERFAPEPLSPEETAALAAPLPDAPEAARLDLPDDLMPELSRSLGDALPEVAAALQARAPLDLRVNTLKTDVASAAAALAAEGVQTEPGPLSPACLRVTGGARRLRNAAPYQDGRVEIQDAASQAVAALADARPGETVLDYCAGGGGKTLALGAAMEGRGRLIAHDADPNRMKDLPARAARAGLTVEALRGAPPKALIGACDLVFIDAPCSGTGAWRRNPDGKWTLAPGDVARFAALQAQILAEAARFVAPGGRLVYATCSLLRAENEDVAGAPPPGFAQGPRLRLDPRQGGDGFFGAVMTRSG
ncbi:RsmB/NOP family class I SAM-dependent RNA methyltransferase [Rhodovulum sp. DZ06]|uniref:RsmB/NOP family class I SAM-dependent RNA methyltransferase n=1 Tax=Rhodovulum sp. DZ06 TaxID=3425126 RepID=UPI003D34002A